MTARKPRPHIAVADLRPALEKLDEAVFPAILNIDQAAKLLQVPRKTLYLWLAAGRLGAAARKRGRRWLFWRDALVEHIFNGAEW
jgi:excisionase family DNA binding protein